MPRAFFQWHCISLPLGLQDTVQWTWRYVVQILLQGPSCWGATTCNGCSRRSDTGLAFGTWQDHHCGPCWCQFPIGSRLYSSSFWPTEFLLWIFQVLTSKVFLNNILNMFGVETNNRSQVYSGNKCYSTAFQLTFLIPTAMHELPPLYLCLCGALNPFRFSHTSMYPVPHHCGFNLHFPGEQWEWAFLQLLITLILILLKCLFKSPVSLLTGLSVYYLTEFSELFMFWDTGS